MKKLVVEYNDYDTINVRDYDASLFIIDEAGNLYISTGGKYIAAYAKGVWRTVNEV